MRLKNYLTELLDTKVPIDVFRDTSDLYRTEFKVNDYTYTTMFIKREIDDGDWEISFARDRAAGKIVSAKESMAVLGDLTPDQTLAVFSAVKESVLKWYKKWKPDSFYFTAKPEEKSRSKLYHTFAKVLSKKLGLKVSTGKSRGEDTFSFYK